MNSSLAREPISSEISYRIAQNQDSILSEWEMRVHENFPSPHFFDSPNSAVDLGNELVMILKAFTRLSPFSVRQKGMSDLNQACQSHGAQRGRIKNYALESVLEEFIVLRKIILNALRAEAPLTEVETDTLFEAIQKGMAVSAAAYTDALIHREDQNIRLNAILESLPDGVYVGDSQGIQKCNRLGIEMLGYGSPEDLKRPIQILNEEVATRDPDTGERIEVEQEPLMRALRGETCIRELEIRNVKNGKDIIVRSAAAPVKLGEQVLGAVVINTDITWQKKLEKERDEAETRLRDLLQVMESSALERVRLYKNSQVDLKKLEQERALHEQFVATLSHDLRNPLTSVKASAQILGRFPDKIKNQPELIQRIIDNIARADRMIQDLLDTHRLRADQTFRLRLQPVDLALLAGKVRDELNTVYGERFIVEATGSVVGSFDLEGMTRVLENLMKNAEKYGEPHAPITIQVSEQQNQAQISVHNWGNPISPEEQNTLFEPFQRTQSAQKSGIKGWGLGLNLVRGMAEAHGGNVNVESSPETGTRFTVRVPIQ